MLNEYYQNIGLKGYFDRYGIVNGIKRGVFIKNPFHIVKDYEMKKVLWQKHAIKKVEEYLKYKDTDPIGIKYGKCNVKNPIWIYWNSGIANAPDIIKKCYESVIKYSNEQVVLLDEENISNYIVLPEYIIKKKDSHNIPIAIYTDLVRFSLLEHFGGTWIDATVLITGEIPSQILESDFFAFRNAMGLLNNPALFPVWFIHAKKGNKTIKEVRNVAYAYWMKEQHVVEYLFSNLIMTNIIQSDAIVEKNILYMDSEYSERLIRIIGEQYSEEKATWMKQLTSIHKLTYKLDESVNRDGSIYRHIIEGKF